MIPKAALSGLEEKGFLQIKYPSGIRALVLKTIASWQRFCQLNETIKESFHTPDQGNVDGIGYQGPVSGKDPKELMEVTTEAIVRLIKVAEASGKPEAMEFIENAFHLLTDIEKPIFEFAQMIENDYGVPDFMEEVAKSRPRWMLRVLHYHEGGLLGTSIGSAHADKSGFTLKLHESTPGLQYLETTNRAWVDMPMNDDSAIIIPNLQLQLRSGGKLKALWHRVMNNPASRARGRYAMVLFVNLVETPSFDREKLGYIQTHQPGFNYDIKPADFEKFFK